MTELKALKIFRSKYPEGEICRKNSTSAGNKYWVTFKPNGKVYYYSCTSYAELLNRFGFNVIYKHDLVSAEETLKKYEKQLSLSKLDGDERAKAEKDNRIAELEEQLAQFQIERNKSELKSVLSSRGLSAEFADIIAISDDIEASQANIDKLDKMFKAAVKAEVEKRLAGNTPKGNGSAPAEITKEAAKRMSMAELNKIAMEQPELFNKLFN